MKIATTASFLAMTLAVAFIAFGTRFEGQAAELNHTAQEEAEGQVIWGKLQAKTINCSNLTDQDFAALGEYFMGLMLGQNHAAMNAMMMQTHGEEGEEQIHIVMGKRLSGCDTSAVAPGVSGGPPDEARLAPVWGGWMPMMNMMTGGWSASPDERARRGGSSPFGFNSMNTMMNFGAFGFFGWIFMILWWVLIIAAVVALIKWLSGQFKGGSSVGRSALDILKERYARGEINKQEFEEKKTDLG